MHTGINKYCPRSGKPVVEDSLTSYRDVNVGFCNSSCRDDFQNNVSERPTDRAYFDALIKELGTPAVSPSETSSKNDFDFLVGMWIVKNRKLTARLAGSDDWTEFDSTLEMKKTLLGLGNFEIYRAEINNAPFEGEAVRVFDPATRLWSIYWADSSSGKLDRFPVTGSFENGIGKFYAYEIFNGTSITVLYQWDSSDPNAPVWSQAFSIDNGETWEWNWYMHLTKAEHENAGASK
jgi:hypothetical protein